MKTAILFFSVLICSAVWCQQSSSNNSFPEKFSQMNNGKSFVENLSEGILCIDRETELNNMFELFGDDFAQEEYFWRWFDVMDSIIINYDPNWTYDFDEWEPFVDSFLTRTTKNSEPYILKQLWSHQNFKYQVNGKLGRMRHKDSSLLYLSRFTMSYDTVERFFVVNEIEEILEALEQIEDEPFLARLVILFMHNLLAKRPLEVHIPDLAEEFSLYLIRTDSIPNTKKADYLLAVNKILAYQDVSGNAELIIENYGRLYSILEKGGKKYNLVKGMEVQLLNALAWENPRRGKFTDESLSILTELIRADRLDQNFNLNHNVSLCEILMGQLISRSDRDYHYSEEVLLEAQYYLRWRMVNLFSKLQKKIERGEHISRDIYDRIFRIKLEYSIYRGVLYKQIDIVLDALYHNNINSDLLHAYLDQLPMLMYQEKDEINWKKWDDHLDVGWNFYVEFMQENGLVNLEKNLSFDLLTEDEKRFYVSDTLDNLMTFIQEMVLDPEYIDRGINGSIDRFNKKNLYQIAQYCAENGKFRNAFIFDRLSAAINPNEKEIELFANLTYARDKAVSDFALNEVEKERVILMSENNQLDIQNQSLTSRVDKQQRKLRKLQQEAASLVKERNALNEDIAQKEGDILAKETLLLEKDSVLQQRENQIAEAEDRKRELVDDYGDLRTVTNQLQFVLIGLGMLFIVAIILWRRSVGQRKLIEEQKTLVEIEKDNVVQEQKKTKALQLSIGQMTHLCKDGVNHLLSKFFNSNDPIKFEQGKQALEALGDAFQKFRENREIFTQSIREEIAFSDTICQFQNPGFSMKYAPSKLAIYNRLALSNRKVPIYTLVNLMSNVIRHSELNDDLSVLITETNEHDKPVLIVESRADLIPSNPNEESTGMQYIESMVELTVDGRASDFTHGVFPDGQGYRSVLPINK